MNEIKSALVYLQYPQPYQDAIIAALEDEGFQVHTISPNNSPQNVEKALEVLEHAEIALLGSGLPKERLENAPNLRWLHFDWVGIEGMLSDRMFETGKIITNGSGRNSICLAEHVFYFIFTLVYGTREILISQNKHQWGVDHINPYSCLYDKTLLVIGTGSIGHEVAVRAKAFGMKTIGYSRSNKKSDKVFDEQVSKQSGGKLESLTKKADFIILATPLNSDTYHLIDASILQGMKETAYLINISRGAVVDEKALVEALKSKTIAGAGSDTFECEPLSESSELWDLPTMIITPHSTPQSPLKFEQGLHVIIENLHRLNSGEKMLNQQSIQDVFNR